VKNLKRLVYSIIILIIMLLLPIATKEVYAKINKGWNKTNDLKWYYSEDGFSIKKGWLFNGGYWYYLNDEGLMEIGLKKVGGKTYFLNSDGSMYTGWKSMNGKWYYFNSDGSMAKGWLFDNKKWYYLNGDGLMETGLKEIGGKTYFLNSDGSMYTGWSSMNGKWYYFNSDGSIAKGWLFDNKKWYYLNGDGLMETGLKEVDKKTYFLNSDGSMHTGWKLINGQWHYFNSDGSMGSSKYTGWKSMNGQWYYFNSDGSMAKGWLFDNKKWYYLDVNGLMQTGLKEIDKKTYLLSSDGSMCTGWKSMNGQWYYFNSDGSMAKGWIEVDGDSAYYLNENGVMQKGWITYEGKEYYLDPSGKMAKFEFVDGKYLGYNGAYKTGDKGDEMVIVIDPGHNFGGDDGAYAKHNGVTYAERDLNMQVSLKLKKNLEENGYKVIMTRNEEDRDVAEVRASLQSRVDIANEVGADLFISLHHDSFSSSLARGMTIFYGTYRPNIETDGMYETEGGVERDRTPSKAAAASIDFANSLINALTSNLGFNNRGSKDYWLYVTKYTTMPSVLLECGFITNPEEAKIVADENHQIRLAEEITKGINKHFQKKF
jgi:N-acetylmuramoyl-L-alanine amidase